MSVEITGEAQLLRELENKLGQQKMQEVSDEALKAGAEVFVRELRSQFESFKDEGYSLDEITISDPMTVSGVRAIRIHWKGPHGRYRIIHLNEFGTMKNPNPKGKGAIARAMRNAEKSYVATVKQAIERGV